MKYIQYTAHVRHLVALPRQKVAFYDFGALAAVNWHAGKTRLSRRLK